ncbi:MAG: tetratricopeptide repeat protein, partial [Planctomycetes bacterium]|nr:tetratricopeptide repeat protein [Planctomycetota bacterium]
AWGLAQWDAYLAKFPRDQRGRMMRSETLALMDPARALGELAKLKQQFPLNLRHRERHADCLWRTGRRADALKEYAALAAEQEFGMWEPGRNALCLKIFLKGLTPVSLSEEYKDRVRDHGDWTTWLASAEKEGGDNAALAARVSAEGQISAWAARAMIRQQSVGRISAALAREQAQVESAKALAAKPDAKPDVKAAARAAVARSERRIAQLKKEIQRAEARSKTAEARLAAFRKATGLAPDQPAMELPLRFAGACLKKGSISAGAVYNLAARLFSKDKEAARPFLEYVMRYSTNVGQVRWAVDRLVELGVAGEDVGAAARTLAAVGMRKPRDGTHAEWLRRSCDLALQSGDVFTFARSAQVLAQLHKGNKQLSGYLDRLGEVFEKAGNFTTAEHEYRRVIMAAREPNKKRRAQLSLAALYEKLGRSEDAINVLSNIVRLEPPGRKQKPRLTPTPPATGKVLPEDTAALLLAARSYLSLEKGDFALDAYDRAAVQKNFGGAVKPERELLESLCRACLLAVRPNVGKATADDKHSTLPIIILQRGEKVLKLVDTIFRFYGKTLTPYQTVSATLLRADATIMMRNYPRAIEEIRAARKAAGDTPAKLLAELKMGEVHLATDNADQAVQIFKKLARLNMPDVSPVALFWLGTTQLKMNRRDDAIESFRILWERFADSELVRQAIYTIAQTYAEQGAFLDAIRLYEAVGAINSIQLEKVAPGDALTAKVWDADHYLGTGEYTIPVQVRSSSGDSERVLLDMNKINHSLFLGNVRTELGEPNRGDGILQVYGTDMIYVTYRDRFKSLGKGEEATVENVQGERTTDLIQVVADASIKVSPRVFVEREEEEDDVYIEKTQSELEEERRLAALSAKLERGEAVIRPGNLVYLRVDDGDLDRSAEPDKIAVTVFTFSPEDQRTRGRRNVDLAQAMAKPLGMPISDVIPSNGDFGWERSSAPKPGNRPRLDQVRAVLTETGPHTGIFYGAVKTDVNGPTAIVSDTSGDNIAAFAIDGKNGSKDAWMGFIDNKPGKWLEIDLKGLYEVGKITWDRGEGADDRYMIDYTVTLRGDGPPMVIERKGNKSAHNNEIPLEKPVSCRWVRFTALTFEGDAPAISQVRILDKDGEQIVPSDLSPLERVGNDILEFNVGDCMAAEILDEENFDPGRPMKRLSNPLGVAYVDGHIDAVYLSLGKNRYLGSLFINEKDNKDDVYVRRTKRVTTDDVLQIAVVDPDLDVDATANRVSVEVHSSSGDGATLEAEEIGATTAVFKARIQLSPNPMAKEEANRLWVRSGDYIVMRYLDEQNRNPGHPVYRASFVFAADEEVADFAEVSVAAESPQQEEGSFSPPHWKFKLRDPDQALPGIDRVEMQAMSFATGDSARFLVLLRDLDGMFSSNLPVSISDKPVIPMRKDADPRAARRIRTLDDHGWLSRNRNQPASRGRGKEKDYLAIPLAVVGDDLVWTSYTDATPGAPAGRLFVPVVEPKILDDLHKLGVNIGALPEEARTEGIFVDLKDPCLALAETKKDREKQVLAEIARKKRHYKRMLATYETTLRSIGKRIEELSPKQPEKKLDEPGRDAPPEAIRDKDVPLTEGEDIDDIAGLEDADLLTMENLVMAAALKRDRDGLSQAARALQRRLSALERYGTDELEAEIDRMEAEYRAQMDERDEQDEQTPGTTPLPWYRKADWWRNCGGVVPGTLLRIRVTDPELAGETAELRIAALGTSMPGFIKLPAKAVPDQQGVYELAVPTTPDENANGALSLKGVRSLRISYEDTVQTKFPPDRSGYLSLASNGTLNVTGPDFLEPKTSFHLGEDIYMIIRDTDMDKTKERDYLWVEITSDVGDKEHFPIRETQPHTGVFRGSIPTKLAEPKENDGALAAKFGGTFEVKYVDELWRGDSVVPPEHMKQSSFVPGTDGTVETFARQLKRGWLQRDVLFSTALAEYELGKSSTEMGAVQRGRRHLLASRDRYRVLMEQYPNDPVCAHATYYLGNIHFLLGDYPAAVKSLQEVIDRWPKTPFRAKALYKLGTCHMKAGHVDGAVECFVNLAYHHSDSPLVAESMLAMAQHFSNNKRYKAAAGVGNAFVNKFPGHEKTGNMYLRLAGWLIVEKKHPSAIELLEEAEKVLPDSPNMPAFLYWHADCLFKQAGLGSVDYKRGIILLQRVTYDYPDSKWARYATARLAEKDALD